MQLPCYFFRTTERSRYSPYDHTENSLIIPQNVPFYRRDDSNENDFLMSIKQVPKLNEELLNQLAGLTGLGWTASMLGFLSAASGYGGSFVPRPQWFLALAVILFVVTLGLDRLTRGLSDGDS